MIKTNAQCAVIASCLLAMSQLATASSSDSATLTAGHESSGCGGAARIVITGFTSGSFGSYSPTALTGGESVSGVTDSTSYGCSSVYRSLAVISGFSSNPGKSWLISITCNGVDLTGAGSANFSYLSGQAYWNWTTPFGFTSGSVYSCTITHD